MNLKKTMKETLNGLVKIRDMAENDAELAEELCLFAFIDKQEDTNELIMDIREAVAIMEDKDYVAI